MKCPYQIVTIHKPEYTEGNAKHFAKDIVQFGDCIKNECPFYVVEHCRRAEREGEK